MYLIYLIFNFYQVQICIKNDFILVYNIKKKHLIFILYFTFINFFKLDIKKL